MDAARPDEIVTCRVCTKNRRIVRNKDKVENEFVRMTYQLSNEDYSLLGRWAKF